MVITGTAKRRSSERNPHVARADGFYMIGKLKHKLRKGSKLPSVYDEIFYYGDSGVEKEEVVTSHDVFAQKFVEKEEEKAAEDGAEETPETPSKIRPNRNKRVVTE